MFHADLTITDRNLDDHTTVWCADSLLDVAKHMALLIGSFTDEDDIDGWGVAVFAVGTDCVAFVDDLDTEDVETVNGMMAFLTNAMSADPMLEDYVLWIREDWERFGRCGDHIVS